MKNFIIFAVLAALLGGCAGKKDQNGIADSEDIAMLSFDKNISTRYRAHNGKLYKNGKVLANILRHRDLVRTFILMKWEMVI